MLKREETIRKLILNGYDDELASRLPKLFIDDFFEKSREGLSEDLDILIDKTQRGKILSYDNLITFAVIKTMDPKDIQTNKTSGIFYNFSSHVKEEFNNIVRRYPLQYVLLQGGAMEYRPELAELSNNPFYFGKEIVGTPYEYRDLCSVSILNGEVTDYYFIMFSDLLSLLKSKGLNGDSISVVLNDGVNGSMYIKRDEIMKLGKGYSDSISPSLQKK